MSNNNYRLINFLRYSVISIILLIFILLLTWDIDWIRYSIGIVIVEGAGTFLSWLLIDCVFWRHYLYKPYERQYNKLSILLDKCLSKHERPRSLKDKENEGASISLPLGIVERTFYMLAFICERPEGIMIWIGLKTIKEFQQVKNNNEKEPRGAYNVFLIGTGLNIIIALIGAWIIMGDLPCLKQCH